VTKNYDTPASLKDKHIGCSCLIIGTGMSTINLLKHKEKIKEKFDVVIGLNSSMRDFENEMDYHLVTEKNPFTVYEYMEENGYRKDLVRVLNYKTIHLFPDDINGIQTTRCKFSGNPNIREYSYMGEEGLLIGPLNEEKRLSLGTVALQAIHLACIIGCTNIYLIGVEMILRGEYDHYYGDKIYRYRSEYKKLYKKRMDIEKLIPNLTKVDVMLNNRKYKTLKYFKDSAAYIDKVVTNICAPLGIRIFDFSDGIISTAEKLDIFEFIDGQKL